MFKLKAHSSSFLLITHRSAERFALIVICIAAVFSILGCNKQESARIDEFHDFYDTKVTIKDLVSDRSESGVKLDWIAEGGIINKMEKQKKPPQGYWYIPESKYAILGINKYPVYEAAAIKGAPYLVLSDGSRVSLTMPFSKLKQNGEPLVTGETWSSKYYDLREIKRIVVPGITVSLPFERTIKITKGIDGNYQADPSKSELDGGTLEVTGIGYFEGDFRITVRLVKENPNLFPIELSSFGLTQESGVVLGHRRNTVSAVTDVNEEYLDFEEPSGDEDLELHVLMVRYAAPGDWTFRLSNEN